MTAKGGNTIVLAIGLACLAVVIGGFTPSYYLRDSARAPLPSLFLIHGAILTARYEIAAVFAAPVTGGVLARHDGAAHKRLTLALVSITLPAFGRLLPAMGQDLLLAAERLPSKTARNQNGRIAAAGFIPWAQISRAKRAATR